MQPQPSQAKPNPRKRGLRILLIILLALFALLMLVYFAWARPLWRNPISETLSLSTAVALLPQDPSQPTQESALENPQPTPIQTQPAPQPTDLPSNLPQAPIFIPPTPQPVAQPVCGEDPAWLVLIAGIDYQGDGYLYGLSDVTRVMRVDFVSMTVNMVALPRDLLVEVPDGRFTVDDPMKLNQTYLFGTPGMGHYKGTGLGAGSLAEAIQFNFGVTVDHYAVINFETIVKFIDAIGGVDVDLPGPITDPLFGDFPAGPQHLTGARALSLARIRLLYSDAFRVSNQTLVLKAVLNKLMTPAGLLKVPALLAQFKNTFLTDLSFEQLSTLGLCFLRNFDMSNLRSHQAPFDILESGWAYIPTLKADQFVYRWDQRFVDWIHASLASQ